MIRLSELPATLRDFIAQFGPPDDANAGMYLSLVRDALVQYPREARVLEISLLERIPEHLSRQRDNIQVYPQIVQEFSRRTGVDVPSAEWVVRVWIEALRIPIPGSEPWQQPVFQGNNPYSQPGGFREIDRSPAVQYGENPFGQPPSMMQQGTPVPDGWISRQMTPSPGTYPPPYGAGNPQPPYRDRRNYQAEEEDYYEDSDPVFPYKTILIPVIIGVCLVLALFFSGFPILGTHDVSGKWKDIDGVTITLTQEGDKVTGNFLLGEKSYDYADVGVDLSGTLSGDVLAFTYTSTTIRNQIITPSRGEGKITFGNSFNTGNLEFNTGIMSGDHLNGDKKYRITRVD